MRAPGKLKICCLIMYEMTYEYRLHAIAKTLSCWGHDVTVVSRKGLTDLPEREYSLHEVAIDRCNPAKTHIKRLIRMIEYYWKFLTAAWSNSKDADLIIASDVMMLPIGVCIARIRRSACIYDMRELWPWTRNHALLMWRLIDMFFIRSADAWVVVNKLRADFIKERYRLPTHGWILHPYPPIETVERKTAFDNFLAKQGAAGKFIALYKGGLWPGNNIETLIDAASGFDQDIVLVIMGFAASETYRQSLIDRARAAPFGRILFHPPVPSESISSFVQSSDLGFVTYTADCVNSDLCEPCKLYDFMMAGVPTVVSKVQGTIDVITRTGVGVLVNFTQAEVCGAVNALFRNKTKYLEMRQKAIRESRAVYNWSAEEETLRELVSSVLASRTRHYASSKSK